LAENNLKADMRRIFFIALRLFLLMTAITGLLYPLAVTGLATTLFPKTSRGSLITKKGEVVGSSLLAQSFDSPSYFWPRPSAANYATLPSGASNLGPTSKALRAQIAVRARLWKAGTATDGFLFPEMISASGSGLDPHISPEAAGAQLARIAKARRWDPEKMEAAREVLDRFTERPLFGFIGQPRINIFLLNLALDDI
jgi:K+-transporting ATPase ATPase C chain